MTQQPTLPEVDNDRLMMAGEVAELLGVPESWVRDHTRQGQIPHIKLGKYVRYVRADVLVWVEEQKTGGAPLRRERARR